MKYELKKIIVNVGDKINIPLDHIIHTEPVYDIGATQSKKVQQLHIFYLDSLPDVICKECGHEFKIVEHKLKEIECPNCKEKMEMKR